MEAPLQIVGCLLSSEPADPLIDGFVTAVRRERAVVTARNAQSATFVKFNAADARLVAMACEAAAGPGGHSLHHGFACTMKRRTPAGQDAWSVSNRCLTQARDLAAAARDGEVLVSPQLALLLVESGIGFEAKEVPVSGGRTVMACVLDLSAAAQPGSTLEVSAEHPRTSALGSVFQLLMAQAEEIARKQGELEARQLAAPGQAAPGLDDGTASRAAGLEADLDAQLARLEARLAAIDNLEQRVDRLQLTGSQVEHQLAQQRARHAEAQGLKASSDTLLTQVADVQRKLDGDLSELRAKLEDLLGRVRDTDEKIETIESRRKMVEEVQSRANGVVHMIEDIRVNLEMLGEQRAVVDHVGEKLARLDFTLQEAHNTLRALQREREVAERIEQGIRALRTRSAAPRSTTPHDELSTTPVESKGD